MPRRTGALLAALSLAATLLVGAGAAGSGSAAPAKPQVGERGTWTIESVAPGRYAVAWRSPTRLPVGSDRPTVVGPAGWTIGVSTTSADGRTVRARVDATTPPDPARLDVLLSGDRIDQTGVDRADRRAAPKPDPALDLAGTVTLPDDPATPGAYAVTTSDYQLAPVRVPGMSKRIEMVGHVVEPQAAEPTGPRPLVLFLHGRHSYCYDPSDPEAWVDRWPCRAPAREIPSHLGYDYVQRVLASQGYATVSVRVNGINAQDGMLPDGGADARARIVQAHLDHWTGLAAAHQVDLDRVVLVGHSRGGEGVDRASIRIPLSAPYRVVGQVLIAPTDFASQTAPYVPTVTLLPYCDGDVSDLQGQQFTDTARDLTTGDTSLKSSVLVMGANHNYFNTEWTPGVAVAPANDDWYGAPGQTCGTRDPQRLSAAEQRAVGTAYVAGAVHLFADGDEAALPLFDGTRARVASQGSAQTLSHAIGGGRALRTPVGSTALSLPQGAETRFCRGTLDQGRVASCGYRVDSVSAAPPWAPAGQAAPVRTFFEMAWTAAGQSGGMLLRTPLDLTGRRLELRTIVEGAAGATLQVRLTDADGAAAVLTPVGGGRLPGLGRSVEVRKLWGQTLVVDPAAASIDLTRVARVDLVAGSGSGRVWVADLAAASDELAAVPARRLPTVDVGHVRVKEGQGGARVARLPFAVHGGLTQPARLVVATVGQTPGDVQRFTIDLAPGQTGGSIPVGYVADRRAGYPELITQAGAWASRNVMTDAYLGDLTVVDDDPRPRISVRAVHRRIHEGEPAQWRVRLSRPAAFDLAITGVVVNGPGRDVTVGDIDRAWAELHVGPVRSTKPLWAAHAATYDALPPGVRTLLVSIPTRRDGVVEGVETLTMRFDLEGRSVRRTVRVVSP